MIEKLQELKKKSHMTNQQIAEKSNIPESTVARVFSGKTPNPTVTTVISMARAMGGSAADLLSEEECEMAKKQPPTRAESATADNGSEAAAAESAETLSVSGEKSAAASAPCPGGAPVQDAPPSEDMILQEKLYANLLSMYKEEIRKKDVWLTRLFWCLAGVMLFILFLLVFDILHPDLGFVKY